MKNTGEILWKDNNKVYINIFKILVIVVFFSVIGVFFPKFLDVMVLLIIIGIIPFIPLFFKRRIKIYETGLFTGNDYKESNNPKPLAYGSNYFTFPFRKSIFINWNDIKKIIIIKLPKYSKTPGGLNYDFLSINTSNYGILIIPITRKFESESIEQVLINKIGKTKIEFSE